VGSSSTSGANGLTRRSKTRIKNNKLRIRGFLYSNYRTRKNRWPLPAEGRSRSASRGLSTSLGAHLEIRLGAIYALERTARDDRDYHWPIMEILTTYVRQLAPPHYEPDFLSFDIQAILTVIARRSEYHRDVEYGSMDLSDTYLKTASLRGADLSGAKFTAVNLQAADFQGANLSDADLRRANLIDANLIDANLTDADLSGANLRGATLLKEQLEGANGDKTPMFPNHLTPPTHWRVKTEGQAEED
jgi:Pentapeptide repeats (8 copies)